MFLNDEEYEQVLALIDGRASKTPLLREVCR